MQLVDGHKEKPGSIKRQERKRRRETGLNNMVERKTGGRKGVEDRRSGDLA